MSASAQQVETASGPLAGLAPGAVAGVGGGLVFGMMMAMMGMLPVLAGMVGSTSAVVGMGIHLMISAVIGASFGLLFGGRVGSLGSGALWGGLYGGVAWWVLGPMVIMPVMMGMPLQFAAAFTAPMLMSLMGHLIYGVVTGLAYHPLRSRM